MRWGRVLAGLLTTVLVTFIGFGVVVPIIPVLVVDDMGGSALGVGLAFAASGVATLLVRPYAGQLAQRYGSRTVMAGGCVLAALVGAAYALPAGVPGLVAVRLVMGVAEALVFTAGSVWIVAIAPEERRAEIVGYYGLAMWSGWTLGPLLALALMSNVDIKVIWMIAALAPLAGLAVLLALPPQPAAGGTVSRRLLPPTVLLPGAALALAAGGYAALTGFVALHLAARDVANGAAMLSFFAAAYVLVRVVAGRVPDRVGPRRVVALCGLAEAVGLTIITLAPGWWQAAVGAVIMGGGFTLLYPALALVVIRRSSPAERGAALGAYTSFWDLGLGASSLLLGAVALAGYAWVFALATVLALAASAIGHLATVDVSAERDSDHGRSVSHRSPG